MEYEDKGDDKTTVITNNHFFKNSTTDNWQTPNADGIDGSLILGGLSGAISGEFSKKGSILGTSQSNGGNGGLGNEHFKASTNTTPKESTSGKDGERADFLLNWN